MVGRLLQSVAIVLAAGVLPAVTFALVYARTIDLPFWDDWSFTPIILAAHAGHVDWAAAWAQHNEHRIFFPSLLMALLSLFGGWSALRETLFGVGLVTLNLAMFWKMIERTVPRVASPLTFLAVSLLTFSLAQWENWFWGAGLGWFMANGFALLALFLVTRPALEWWEVALALIACAVSAYSSLAGLACLPAVLLAIFLRDRIDARAVCFWCAGSVAILTAYFHGFDAQPRFPASSRDVASTFLPYVLAYLGAPLGSWSGIELSEFLGAFALVVFAAAAVRYAMLKRAREKAMDYVPWLALCAFAIPNALLTGYGRAGLGVSQGMSSRYTTMSADLWIGAIVLAVLLARDATASGRLGKTFSAALGVVAIFGFVFLFAATQSSGYAQIATLTDRTSRASLALRNEPYPSDRELELIYPDPSYVRGSIATLRALRDAHLEELIGGPP